VKRMCVVEEEVSLSQPKTTAVLPEEEEVPVSKGPVVVVPPGEEEVPAPPPPLSRSRYRAPLSWSCRRKKSHRAPYHGPVGGRGGPSPPCRGPVGRKGMSYLGTALGKFFTLLFFSKTHEILLALFLINAVDL
jgi:hypothetical protein